MQFSSLEPFVPSGNNFESSRQLFEELGFTVSWDAGDYVGFQKDASRFILQKFDNREFAENFMISVKVDSVDALKQMIEDKKLPEKFGIRIAGPMQQSYGRELNLIDLAGVCWHFVEG